MSGWRAAGRLAYRQGLLAALLGVVFGAGFSVLQVSQDYRRSVDAERREILQMMTVMQEPAAQACYNLNAQAAKVIVQGALSYMPVLEASLVSDFGDRLAQGRNEAIATTPHAWWTRFVPPTQAYGLPLAFGPQRQRVGELKVVTAQAPRVEKFLANAWRDLGLNLLRSLSVALALGALSFVTLTRPLTAVARRIGRGRATAGSTPMPEASRPDEIGQIASAFERYEREADERAQSLEATARALAASELRYRRIVETAGEGVWQVDEDGRTTLANHAMARMLAARADKLTGRSLFDFVDPADQPKARALLQHRQASDIDGDRHELRLLAADGRVIWAEVSTCPVLDAEGHFAGTLAMVTNATERRRRDEELRATNTRLTSMVADLERHKSDMAHIAELNELLQSARTMDEAFEVVRATAPRLFADTSGGIAVPVRSGDLDIVGAWGDKACLPTSYPRSDCWTVRRGAPHYQSPQHGVRCGHRPPDHKGAMLCTPLYVDGELIGVLHLHSPDEGADFAGSVRQRVEVFGEVVKLGLSNLRLRESLREQALRDALTGLPNRRLFDETLPRELSRCLRSGQALTLAVVDVDHFKHFNDTYGHDVGDRVLRSVAQVLVNSIRASDLACRYGGDEFMCLLPGMSGADAKLRFEQALQSMAAAAGTTGLPPETVTFTVGVASVPECGTDLAALNRAADAALYLAKERGRNRVEMADEAMGFENSRSAALTTR